MEASNAGGVGKCLCVFALELSIVGLALDLIVQNRSRANPTILSKTGSERRTVFITVDNMCGETADRSWLVVSS